MKTLKKDSFFILCTLLAMGCLLLSGCGKERSGVKPKIANLSDLNRPECIIGGELGTFALNTAEQKFPRAKFHSFNLCMDAYPALAAGKINALVYDRPPMEYAAMIYPDFILLPENLARGKISICAPLTHKDLIAKVNVFIAQYKQNGMYQEMYDRWVRTRHPVMPDIPEAENSKETLRIGVIGDNQPMSYVTEGGRLTGFDIEFSRRLALALNMKCKLILMDYNALLSACAANKIDLAVANMDATEERRKSTLFSDYYIESPIAVMIRKEDYAGTDLPSNHAVARLNRPDKKIGVPQGAMAMSVGEKLFNKAKILYFGSISDGYAAVKYKKIDAFLFDRHSMKYAIALNPELKLLPENFAEEHIVIGLPKKKIELRDKVNDFIREYRKNGVYQDMCRRWLDSTAHVMPNIPSPSAPTMKLKIGTEGLNEPMNYFGKDGKITGFDVEFIKRLAVFLNADVEIETMTYSGLLTATAAGRIDMMIASLNATPERAQNMLMTIDYVDSAVTAMVHKDYSGKDAAPAEKGIRSLADLQGKKAASMTGSAFQQLTDPLQPGIQHIFFNDNYSSVAALRAGKVDAVLLDKPMAQMFASLFPTDTRFVCVYARDSYGFAFRKGSPLTERVSKIIRELKKTGEMKNLTEKWLTGKDAAISVWTHKKDFDGSAGVLRYASNSSQEPMCYLDKNGEPCGLDIEVMRRIAYELNMEFKFIPMNFGSLIESLFGEKADSVGGSMSITEERRKRVDFAESYYEGGLSILARKQSEKTEDITGLSHLAGKRVGILSGTTQDMVIKQHLPQSIPTYFNSFTDLPVALNAGKIEAFLIDRPQFTSIKKQYPAITMLPQQLSHDEYAFVFARKNRTLCDEFSRQIRNMKSDGTLKKLDSQWFSDGTSAPTIQIPPVASPKGTLRFAIVPQMEPFSFMREGKPVGYDLDTARIAAARMGYTAEPVIMDFSAMLEAVSSGKVDFGASCITITEERKQKMLFSESNYQGGIVAVVMTPHAVKPETASFWKNFEASFERTFVVEKRWKLILDGLKITLVITVLSAILGTILAFPICFLRRSKRRIPKWIGGLYVSLLQGTPILVILMLLYYVVFAKCDIDAVLVAIIGFGLNFAAYAGEMLRTGIDAVPPGQIEAAKALSLTRFQTFRKVVFPQAARQILPVYRGEFINMLKTTSIVGYIAIQDLTKMSDIIRSRTYEAFFPLIATAAIYFAAAWFLASLLNYFEYRLTPGRRIRTAKGGSSK